MASTPVSITVTPVRPVSTEGQWFQFQTDGDIENNVAPVNRKLWVWLNGQETIIPAGWDEDATVAQLNSLMDVVIVQNPPDPANVKPKYVNRFNNIPDPTP
jgi:hypothetical protein